MVREGADMPLSGHTAKGLLTWHKPLGHENTHPILVLTDKKGVQEVACLPLKWEIVSWRVYVW